MMKKIIAALLMFAAVTGLAAQQEISILSCNILFKNKSKASFTALGERILMADATGIQETNPIKAKRLARKLGLNVFVQDGLRAILTKHEIVDSAGKEGALIRTPEGVEFWVFNLHLPPVPYGPYDLANIGGYFGKREFSPESADDLKDLLEMHVKGRSEEGEFLIFREMLGNRSKQDLPVFVTGDFNEPSHLDWIAESVDAGLFPVSVPWPTSIEMEKMGFSDSFRVLNPSPAAVPGFTWSPLPKYQTNVNRKGEVIPEPFDRIDFVYFMGSSVQPVQARLIGPEGDEGSDLHIKGFSSDHRSLLLRFRLK